MTAAHSNPTTAPTAPSGTSPRRRQAVVVLLAAVSLSGQAIVYTLRSGTSHAAVADRLHAKVALKERVTVGEYAGQLTVALSDVPMPQALHALESLLHDGRRNSHTGAVLVEEPSVSGRTRRHLLLSLGDRQRTLLISMDLPDAAFRPDRAGSWPPGLPRPRAGRIGLALTLPARDAAFASFSVNRPASLTLREYNQRLEGAGWKPVSRESGTCIVYADKRGTRLAVFGVMTDRNGLTRAAVFVGGRTAGI